MAQPATTRPQLVSPRSAQTLEAARNPSGSFDIDAFHVMNERDNALIAQEIIHGAGSSKFVYDFKIGSTPVSGISVIGARHLAAHYGGLRHRLVASAQKIGELFTFTSFPAENMPMHVSCNVVRELADEPDYYQVVVEVVDIKTGNAIQVECRENRWEQRKDGSSFERPHYAKIAQSKGYRNAVLDLLPQDLQIKWKEQMLKLGKNETITASVIDEKRANVLQFAAKNAIALDRRAIEALTIEQIAGLGDAAREGRVPAFVNSAKALGLELDRSNGGSNEVRQIESEKGEAPERRDPEPAQQNSANESSDRQRETSEPQSSADAPPPAGRKAVNFEV